MPSPPDVSLPPSSQVQECFTQMRLQLLLDMKDLLRVGQKEALEQQRALVENQELSLKKTIAQVMAQGAVQFSDSKTSPEQVPEYELKSPPEGDPLTAISEEAHGEAVGEGTDVNLMVTDRGATWIGVEDRTSAVKHAFDPESLLRTEGVVPHIVRSHWFHGLSTFMICTNACYLGIEADWNTSKDLMQADWSFQFCEHLFTTFFFVELLLRFGAFEKKCKFYLDYWFLLDLFMVILMVLETWISPIVLAIIDDGSGEPKTGPMGGIGRLFRLLRLLRVSKLMQMMPELVTMVKGMIAAIRATQAALLILILLVYVFAIIMNAMLKEEADLIVYYGSVRDSMVTLLVQGVLLDDISGLVRDMISCHTVLPLVILASFILLSALTVMNMLIGVLCEVVLDVSADEKENLVKAQMRKTLLVMLNELDEDKSGMLSKAEVQSVIRHPEAIAIMNDIQVDTTHLLDVTEMLFPEEDSVLSISVFMNIVLTLRGKRPPTMGDFAKNHNMSMWSMERLLAEHRHLMKDQMDLNLQKASLLRQQGK